MKKIKKFHFSSATMEFPQNLKRHIFHPDKHPVVQEIWSLAIIKHLKNERKT